MGRVITNDRVLFGATEIVYSIRRSPKRSHLAITVCGPLVEVAAPTGMRAKQIRPHVIKKGAWILSKLDETGHHAAPYPERLQAGVSLRLLGRQYLLRVCRGMENRPRLRIVGTSLILETCGLSLQHIGRRLFKERCRRELEEQLPGIIEWTCKQLGIPTAEFRVSDLGNRWGSCSVDGTLNFHWLLATQSMAFLHQVVAHEACHLVVPSHSPRFRRLLERFSGISRPGIRGGADY